MACDAYRRARCPKYGTETWSLPVSIEGVRRRKPATRRVSLSPVVEGREEVKKSE